jgi:hypothetical protein
VTYLTRPIGYLPITMSLAALAVIVAHVLFVGTARQADEGAAAHLWQLLMGGQLPIILAFALTALPRSPKQASIVLGFQLLAGVAAALPVFLLRF